MNLRSAFVFTLLFLNGIILPAQQKQFTLMPHDSTGVDFVNVIIDTKDLNVISYEYFYNGAGVAIGDINNDGLPDIYFTSNVQKCKLYLNQGNLKFKDVTREAGVEVTLGYKTGVEMVDINNDGWMDIYVCKSVGGYPEERKNVLYINNRNGTFTDRAAEYGVDDEGFSMQSYFNDMDGDGDLDLLVLNHPYNLNFAKTIHLAYNKKGVIEAIKDPPLPFESDRYYENVNGKFVNRTEAAGLATRAFGLSAILEDFNNDGLTDIYQCNDYLEPDYLFINKGNNKFVNEFDNYFKHGSYSSMGSDYGDINNDGLNDLITVDMLAENNYRQKQLRRGNNYDEFEKVVKYGFGYQYVKNVLQLNNGNNTYSDISYYTNMAFSDWSWAALMADFDNDGWKDIYISNGQMREITDMDYGKFYVDSIKKELVRLKDDKDVLKLLSVIPSVKVQKFYFKNYGGLDFKKENNESGLTEFAWSFGVAYADLDNDGDLDLVVNNSNDYAFIYRNNTAENGGGKAVSLRLNGPPKNINGIGTRIESLSPDGLKQTITCNPMKGYLSSNDYTTLIGIGKNQSTNLTVTWPDGKQQVLNNVSAEHLVKINYNDAGPAIPKVKVNTSEKIFEDITAQTKINYTYKENEYIDFKLEPLLPHRFSQLGPCLTVGDFNGDSLQDIFAGGAKNKSAVLFLQNTDGTFSESVQPAFVEDKMYEDGAAAIIDIDNDGDNDLIVVCGGNEYPNKLSMYPVRIYLNNGKGIFTKQNIPNNEFNTSANTIAIGDYNKDGKKDIFIGGRVVPGRYGLIPKSFLLENNNGQLADVTDQVPALARIGMVTSAIWSDVDQDGWSDLIVAGEWMPVTIFHNRQGKLSNEPTTIANSNGWWNHIYSADLNNDGSEDIVAGNLGLNTRYRGTVEQPVTMVVSDFDDNGSTDCLISTFVKGKSYPIAIRDYVLDQMPFLRKKFLRYKQYSNATVQDIFTVEQLAKASKFLANEMSTVIFMNNGKGEYVIKQLPAEAQLFPVNGIQVADVNGDNIPDLLLTGNDYSTEVETGRNDAGIGLVLTGKGNAEYAVMPVIQSGFFTPGNVKCLEKITIAHKPSFIVGKNQGAIQIIGYSKSK